jgi:hypothetical protein
MVYRKSLFIALGMAVGMMLTPGATSASPTASGLANSGIAAIASEANQVTKVRRRGRGFRRGGRRGGGFRRGRRSRGFRRGGGFYYGGLGYGLGYPYYYGGYPYGYYGGYPYGYYDDYYYRPRIRRSRRSYRGSRSCRRAHRACVSRWGYGGGNYDGCMRYERCRPR